VKRGVRRSTKAPASGLDNPQALLPSCTLPWLSPLPHTGLPTSLAPGLQETLYMATKTAVLATQRIGADFLFSCHCLYFQVAPFGKFRNQSIYTSFVLQTKNEHIHCVCSVALFQMKSPGNSSSDSHLSHIILLSFYGV
jgi:hypothetical protein